MQEYLSQSFDINNPELVSVYDELPLWSAPFGLTLLEKVQTKKSINALDIGCGTGFPFLELAQRLGNSSKIFGIDPWESANERVRQKIKQYGVTNATIVKGCAEELPFENDFFDLVVSNNGINNVSDPQKTLRECYRVCKKNAQLVFTMNLPGTMLEFYNLFAETLKELDKPAEIEKLKAHIAAKRKTMDENYKLFTGTGFIVKEASENFFTYKFADGAALLNYYFIRLAFIDNWKNILQKQDVPIVFQLLENKLNLAAEQNEGITLTIPYGCFDCRK